MLVNLAVAHALAVAVLSVEDLVAPALLRRPKPSIVVPVAVVSFKITLRMYALNNSICIHVLCSR